MLDRTLPRLFPGDLLVACLALLPLLLLVPGLINAPPADASGWLRLGGRVTGVLGLGWLLLAGILAIRLPYIDSWFGGLTRLWYVHHLLGTGSFLLVLAHPLLLAFAAMPGSLEAATLTLFPPLSEWAVWAGWGGLVAMMVFLAPTYAFFGQPHYQRWKMLHLWSGLALLLGLVHGYALASARPEWLAVAIWLALGLLGLAAYLWRAVLARRFARRPYRITSVETPAPRVVELTLKPEKGEVLRYRAGQFVYMSPTDPALEAGRNEEHPYTLSSAPAEPHLRIAIKDLGDATRALQTVGPGTRAWIEGPYGGFLPAAAPDLQELWIGGGIGLTPFISRARAFDTEPPPADVQLIYCAQDESRAYFLDELQAIAGRTDGFSIIRHFFALRGPLERAFVAKNVPGCADRRVMICGPLPLIDLARSIALDLGVPRRRIFSEEFNLL